MRAVRECERSEYSLVCAYPLTQLATHLISGLFFPNPSFRSDSIRVPSPQPICPPRRITRKNKTLELLSVVEGRLPSGLGPESAVATRRHN
jgi:hypothetical protein